MRLIINTIFFFIDSVEKTKIATSKKVITTIPDEGITLTVQLALLGIISLVLFTFFLYLMNQLSKHWDFLNNLREPLKKNYFIIFLLFPFFYLIYYYAFYLPQKDSDSIWVRPETVDFLLKASLTSLGTGVLTGGLKWLNNLAFFRKQFSDLIKSDEFSNVLSEKMKDLALSDDYLLQRNDLEEIWTRVTLCKYKQRFPELAQEIQKKIENDLFVEQSLSYYYKNFRLQINLSLDGDIIKTTEISSYTVISNSTDKIEINFGTNSPVEDSEGIYAKIIEEECKCDGTPLKLTTEKGKDAIGNIDPKNTRFITYLEGKKKYIIERKIEMTQDIKDDRIFSFASSRIIEDLSINLKLDEKLDIYFAPVGKNIFYNDNHVRSEQSKSYINRDLLLPGEKFKVFIFKKS